MEVEFVVLVLLHHLKGVKSNPSTGGSNFVSFEDQLSFPRPNENPREDTPRRFFC
jgi:hypothetical protein